MLAGFRQTARIRQQYLTSALQQEISFFDTQATTGDLLQGLNELSNTIQSGIGEKAGNTLHHLGTFAAGFAIGMHPLHGFPPRCLKALEARSKIACSQQLKLGDRETHALKLEASKVTV